MMMARERVVKSALSGASTSRIPSDAPPLDQPSGAVPGPASHGLLVALVSAPESQTPDQSAWPLWLVPRINRRSGSRVHSRSAHDSVRE